MKISQAPRAGVVRLVLVWDRARRGCGAFGISEVEDSMNEGMEFNGVAFGEGKRSSHGAVKPLESSAHAQDLTPS